MRRPLLPWAIAVAILPIPATAQQVVEFDFAAGRSVINDEWNRDMRPDFMTVDWERYILYVRDAEEPEGLMAFSLETGELLRAILTPPGDGPHEFPQGAVAVDLAAHGGLYVSGLGRVVEFDIAGNPISSWRPTAPTTQSVCNFGGAPAVPTQGGVVRRSSDGTDEEIGPIIAKGVTVVAPSDDLFATGWRTLWSRIACMDDRAYYVIHNEYGADSVFVYHRHGPRATLPLPTEGIEGMMDCRPPRRYNRPGSNKCPVGLSMVEPSIDDLGNLVLLGFDNKVHGVIIDPATGCHALIRNTTRLYNMPTRIYADSALVFHQATIEVEVNGEKRTSFRDTAYGVSMVPIRRVSGAPCSGMLPTVK